MNPYSEALSDYFQGRQTKPLWIETSYGTKEEMPVDVYFRTPVEFTTLEHLSINLCEGKILDVGAAVGAMSLDLQQKGYEVIALDMEARLVEISRQRGVDKAMCANIFNIRDDTFDTVLMMMNGIGLVGTLEGLKDFLIQAKSLLNTGGQMIIDSSDISYLYEDLPKPDDRYFGELSYRYRYKNRVGQWFDWLYVDAATLINISEAAGWEVEIVYTDEYDQYLARMKLADKDVDA